MRRVWSGTICGLMVLALLALRDPSALAQIVKDPSTVWLVRHAEKAEPKNQKEEKEDNPGLTKKGLERAEDLATHLSGESIKAIVTSHKQRTVATARPLAKNITVTAQEIVFEKKERKEHIKGVVDAVLAAQGNVLVVGHSDTLQGIITGVGGAKMPKIEPVCSYDRLFKIDMKGTEPKFSESTYGKKSKC